ncbi:hypothetical protein [Brevibacillus brevis]|uniref:hypothetical protein n=1 Tax=Brevibacillus brevis TaxID=1393 RepID=UPI0007D8C6B9|nr:hypothetical protein [Brevibacillus brevis]
MGNTLIVLTGDDWEGLFYNGKLIEEEHSIHKSELVNRMKQYQTFDVRFLWLNNMGLKWIHNEGSFPSNFEDVPKEYFG